MATKGTKTQIVPFVPFVPFVVKQQFSPSRTRRGFVLVAPLVEKCGSEVHGKHQAFHELGVKVGRFLG